jgi:flagellar biosynthesis/type III secretory pathway chaperone
MNRFKLATVTIALLAAAALVWASESDELREKAEAMHREAAELAERGHLREAGELKEKAAALLEEAEHLERGHADPRQREIAELKQLLERLHQEQERLREEAGAGERLAELRRKTEQVEHELHELLQPRREPHREPHRKPHREQPFGQDEIARRLEHMRIAVEHLHQAGLHEIAEHVAQRAEATERELHEHARREHEPTEHGPHPGPDAVHEIMKQLDALRHEVGRLRDEVNELRERR